MVADNRGKAGKVTIEIISQVVNTARKLVARGKKIRLKIFTRQLKDADIHLSAKTVGEILIANGLRAPQTRKRRPGFYQSLRQQIPNGVVAADGSEFTVWIGQSEH